VKVIYLVGSLRDPAVPEIGRALRAAGFDVFDDWHAAGPIADDSWRDYEKARNHSYTEALNGHAANHVFDFDYLHLQRADIGVMVMPAGKSGHLEIGYLAGQGKPAYILFDKEPERYDVMYKLCAGICFSLDELLEELGNEVQSSNGPDRPGDVLRPSEQDSGPQAQRVLTWDGSVP
jgi:nucleoside 2-deoxyribosyltransferase